MIDRLSNNDDYGSPVGEIDLKTLSKGDSILMRDTDGVDRYFYVSRPDDQPVGLLVDVYPNKNSYTINFRLLGAGVINHVTAAESIVNSHSQEIPPMMGKIAVGCFPIFGEVDEPDNNTRSPIYIAGSRSTICELYLKKE